MHDLNTNKDLYMVLDIEEQPRSFHVYCYRSADPRFQVRVDNDDVAFSLMRTPVGQWLTGTGRLPGWVLRNIYAIGDAIESFKAKTSESDPPV